MPDVERFSLSGVSFAIFTVWELHGLTAIDKRVKSKNLSQKIEILRKKIE